MSYEDTHCSLDEFLESQRSPVLSRSQPHADSLDTPPPLVDIPDTPQSSGGSPFNTFDVALTEPQARDRYLPACLCNAPLVDQSGFRCTSCTVAQARERLVEQVQSSEARKGHQMIGVLGSQHVPFINMNTAPVTAERLDSQSYPTSTNYSGYQLQTTIHPQRRLYSSTGATESRAKADDSEDFYRDRLRGSQLSLQTVLDRYSRSHIPETGVPCNSADGHSPGSSVYSQTLSTTRSPIFAKFAITASDSNSAHLLPKIVENRQEPASTPGINIDSKQTLPSLQTTLSAISDTSSALYPDSAFSKPCSGQVTQHARSPPNYPPMIMMSPPRLPQSTQYLSTLSRYPSSNSAASDIASRPGSNHESTPASSLAGYSPGASHALRYTGSENGDFEEKHDRELPPPPQVFVHGSDEQGYRCTVPGCTAQPFQTQYLLNSHTNVHSSSRPHFCPVADCARGPAGQGFKRKNEMIRHGLVHQSPGYICPFCIDQQHRYPRPDNLQRHVRVHHVDKDRDDPALRDVLAQRPEGGNRGRRRRLGS